MNLIPPSIPPSIPSQIPSSSPSQIPLPADLSFCSLAWAATITKGGKRLPGYCFALSTQQDPQDTQDPRLWNQEAELRGVRRKVVCDTNGTNGTNGAQVLPLLSLVEATPWLDWLIVTNNPGALRHDADGATVAALPDNLWLGTRISSQEDADARFFPLLEAPARVRFLLCDPLLEPLDLHVGLHAARLDCCLDWVIVGGAAQGVLDEWGNQHKCFVDDIRHLVQQCQQAACPVFVSQLGADVFWDNNPADQKWLMNLTHPSGADIRQWPKDLRLQQIPTIASTLIPTQGEQHVS